MKYRSAIPVILAFALALGPGAAFDLGVNPVHALGKNKKKPQNKRTSGQQQTQQNSSQNPQPATLPRVATAHPSHHPGANRASAETTLAGRPRGSWMLRPSSNPGVQAISISDGPGRPALHRLVHPNQGDAIRATDPAQNPTTYYRTATGQIMQASFQNGSWSMQRMDTARTVARGTRPLTPAAGAATSSTQAQVPPVGAAPRSVQPLSRAAQAGAATRAQTNAATASSSTASTSTTANTASTATRANTASTSTTANSATPPSTASNSPRAVQTAQAAAARAAAAGARGNVGPAGPGNNTPTRAVQPLSPPTSGATSSTAPRRNFRVLPGGQAPAQARALQAQRTQALQQNLRSASARRDPSGGWNSTPGTVPLHRTYHLEYTTEGHLYGRSAGPFKQVYDAMPAGPGKPRTFESWVRGLRSLPPAQQPASVRTLINNGHRMPTEVTYLNQAARSNFRLQMRQGKVLVGGPNGPAEFRDPTDGRQPVVFVVSPNGAVYTGKYERGKFHHSSLLAGGNVRGAGELRFDRNGNLKTITDKSGHYAPDKLRLLQGLKALRESGVSLDDVDLTVGSTPTGKAGQFFRDHAWRLEPNNHGPMRGPRAAQLLAGQPPRTWLIRVRSTGEGVVSYVNDNGGVEHTTFQNSSHLITGARFLGLNSPPLMPDAAPAGGNVAAQN